MAKDEYDASWICLFFVSCAGIYFPVPEIPFADSGYFATRNSYYVAPNGNDSGSCTSIYQATRQLYYFLEKAANCIPPILHFCA